MFRLAFHTVQASIYAGGDGPRHKVTKTAGHVAISSTSISDRNIWIPPVPALSDVGTFEDERPRTAGPFVVPGRRNGIHAWRGSTQGPSISRSTPCVDGALPGSPKKQGRTVPRLPAPLLPHRAPVPAPVPIPVTGACGASHGGCYWVICKYPANFRVDFDASRPAPTSPPRLALKSPPRRAPSCARPLAEQPP